MKASLEAGHVVGLPSVDTIADGVCRKNSWRFVIPLYSGKRGRYYHH